MAVAYFHVANGTIQEAERIEKLSLRAVLERRRGRERRRRKRRQIGEVKERERENKKGNGEVRAVGVYQENFT